MSTTEKAAAIRTFLKNGLGLTNRDVSIKSDHSSISAKVKTVKGAKVLGEIKKAVKSAEHIERCEMTGEILSGCNTYCNTNLENSVVTEMLPAIGNMFGPEILAGFRRALTEGVGCSFQFEKEDYILRNRDGHYEMLNGDNYTPHWVGSPVWNDEQLHAALCRVLVGLKFGDN